MTRAEPRVSVARGIADALLGCDNNQAAAKVRLRAALGRDWPWFDTLLAALQRKFGAVAGSTLAALHEPLIALIAHHRGYLRAWDDLPNPPPKLAAHFAAPRAMQKRAFPLDQWAVPALPTPGELAHWLGLSAAELDWFTAQGGYARAGSEALRHYRYQWIAKRNGSLRLLEIPKSRLMRMQRQILQNLLAYVPPHEAAHGFRAGHSCLTHAHLHAGQSAVLRMDLRNFFASVPAVRVNGIFGALGYPRAVAWALTGLCTHAPERARLIEAGSGMAIEWRTLNPYTAPHLPQGAPTSPLLANLCAFKLDLRLSALAADAGAVYSRYADDLAFSGGDAFARGARRLLDVITRVVVDEGFSVNPSKTRLMRSAQRQTLTGLVVNQQPNLRRQDVDRLKAVLHRCVTRGPAGENREGVPNFREHLRGRVAHVRHVHPGRGAKLRALFDAIDWNAMSPPA